MSDSDSEVSQKEEFRSPETAGEVVKEVFVRILAGLGAVGRGLRGGLVATGSCVQHAVYPIKEGCIYGYDEAVSYFNPSSARRGQERQTEGAVCFSEIHDETEPELA